MLIITDTTGLTIKRTIQSENFVRVGILQTALWVDGTRRNIRPIGKPGCEYTLNDCSDLLAELDHVERMTS
jgi:hypothetical protein